MHQADPVICVLVISAILLTPASGSSFFRVVDVSPVEVNPGDQANFSVVVKGLGSETQYVKLVFRDIPEGLRIADPGRGYWIFPAGTRRYDLVLAARDDIAPANYSFKVGVAAKGAPPNFRSVDVTVKSPNQPLISAYDRSVWGGNLSSAPDNESILQDGSAQQAAPFPAASWTAALMLFSARHIIRRYQVLSPDSSQPKVSFIIR